MSEQVTVVDEGAVRRLTLARPAQRNALDLAMYEALTAAVSSAADDGMRAIVLAAEGPTFCAGNDMRDFLANPPTGMDSPVMRFLQALSDLELPLIAAVRGAAVGIGTTVLLHCDLAWCTPDAKFILPFAKLGAVPEAGSSRLLPLRVGHRRAFELLVLGAPATAEEAVRDGLVNGVMDDPEVAAMQAAAALVALSPEAVRHSKRLLKAGPERSLAETLSDEGETFIACTQTDAFKRAVEAFLSRGR